jgi:hypothetical protein
MSYLPETVKDAACRICGKEGQRAVHHIPQRLLVETGGSTQREAEPGNRAIEAHKDAQCSETREHGDVPPVSLSVKDHICRPPPQPIFANHHKNLRDNYQSKCP